MTAIYITAALPLNAHTYRLLIFKEPCLLRYQLASFASLRIVLFVSSREARLCGMFQFSSTSFLIYF